MNRKNTIILFLSLIENLKNGGISDTLWMKNSDTTIWEFLQGELGIDGEIIGDDLERTLKIELNLEERKEIQSPPSDWEKSS